MSGAKKITFNPRQAAAATTTAVARRARLGRYGFFLFLLFSQFAVYPPLGHAQAALGGGGTTTGQWITFGADPQRSGWAQDEKTFNARNVSQLKLSWKAILPNEPSVLTGLAAPLVINNVETATGVKSLVIVAGSSDHLFALDANTGEMVWKADFPVKEKPKTQGTWLCPNALTATPVIDPQGARVFAVASDGRLYTLSLKDGKELQPALRFLPAFSKMWSLNYVGGVVYSTLSQDCNDARSAVVGIDPDKLGHPVITFWSTQNCGGGWCGGGIWGRGGVSADFDGFLYAAIGDANFDASANQFGNAVVKLEPVRLGVSDYFVPQNWEYIKKLDLDLGNTTPVVFRWKDRVLSAVGGKEGLLYLMDVASLGGADKRSAALVSPLYSNEIQSFQRKGVWGSISSFRDAAGDTWLFVPMWGPPVGSQDGKFEHRNGEAPNGSIMAFKVVADGQSRPVLQPVWRSGDLNVPDPPAIAGDVVFALATGEDTRQATVDQIKDVDFSENGNLLNSEARVQSQRKSGTAVLHALDARTGRELWNSGKTITDWTHFTGVAVGAGKVFTVTNSGELYAFGFGNSLGAKSYVQKGGAGSSAQSQTSGAQGSAPGSAPAAAVTPPPAAATNADLISKVASRPIDRATATLYQTNCAMCHAQTGAGIAGARTPDLTRKQWQAAHSDQDLIKAIREGKEGGMPAFGGRLTPEQITKLAAYVRSLGAQ